jgi:tetratricopeptide (TPR) repeat protein
MNSKLAMELMRHANILAVLALAGGLLAGCREKPTQPITGTTSQQRYEAAKALFEKASREFHIPSAQARGVERAQFEDRAAAIYTELARHYSDQPIWAAQALRSLGNIHATRTNLTEAVRAYAEVAEKFPRQDFEVLMAWKSAGDLLSDASKPAEAKVYYEKLLARFDKEDALPIVQSVVRGAKARLNGQILLSARESQ